MKHCRLVFASFVVLFLFALVACDAEVYTVSFYDGNVLVSSQTVEYGGQASMVTPPAKQGYTFLYWKTDSGLQYNFNSAVIANLNLFAVYEDYCLAYGHDWGTVVYTWNSDYSKCTAQRICKNNPSHTEEETVSSYVVVNNPTCIADGEGKYTADFSNAAFGKTTETISIAKLGHSLVFHDGKVATCTDNGWQPYYTCTRCDYTTYKAIPAAGHAFSTAWTKDDTYHWHDSTCGHEVVADKTIHIWDTGKITTPSTCTTTGIRTYTCTICGQSKAEQIPDSHTYGPEVNLGNGVLSKTCSVCGYENVYTQDQYVVLTLIPNNGNETMYFSGSQGDTMTLPIPTRIDYGITSDSLRTPREYQFACWCDEYGNEYLPGNMYSFPSRDVTLEAKYYVNIAVMKPNSPKKQFEDYFNGSLNYDYLDIEQYCQSMDTSDIVEIFSVKSECNFAISSQHLEEGYSLIDFEGNEYSLTYKSQDSDFELFALPHKVHITFGTSEYPPIEYTIPYGHSVQLLPWKSFFKNDGYLLIGWNTKVDGSGTSYADEYCGKFTSDLTLYAQWLKLHTVTCDANGGEGAMTPMTDIDERVNTTLSKNVFAREGYVFIGWNTKADGSGTSYADKYCGKFTSDLTLFAQWGLPIGSQGPAGGLIFYDCDADNATGNADGLFSNECGWRYLEVSPEDLSHIQFGYFKKTSDGDTLYVNGTTTYTEGTFDPNDGKSTGTAIGTGKANTEKLVNAMGSTAYTSSFGVGKTNQYAAKLADNYVYSGYGDWFLPSKDELYLMYTNLKTAKLLGGFASDYWSSSEDNNDALYAWKQPFNTGLQSYNGRGSTSRVRCVRAFTPFEQLNPSSIYLAETIEPTCTESGWKIYRFVDTDKEACRVLAGEPIGHVLASNGYNCCKCGHLMVEVGIKGPAGGYVFYDCDEDNERGNPDSLISSECGWRYLEAAPEDVMFTNINSFIFGCYRISSSDLLYVNGTTTYTEGTFDPNDGKSTGSAIGTGKANTEKLVNAMGVAAYTKSTGTNTTDKYVAKFCDDYVYGGYGDWFLPSEDELNLMYTNLKIAGLGSFASDYYWSSSEYSNHAYNAWKQSFSTGSQTYSERSSFYRVRCVRAFTPFEQLNSSSIYLTETIEPTCTESGWKVYRFVDTDKEACRVLDKEPTGHTIGSDGYHCADCGQLMFEVGCMGPSGGIIFYDCDTDNATGNADGLISTECGWRFLEAAPEDVKIGSVSTFVFGCYRFGSTGKDFFVNFSSTFNESNCTGTAIGTGKNNTAKLVKAMGSAAYTSEFGTETTNQYAAKLADNYVYGGYGDWFLPSKDELNLMYTNLKTANLGEFVSDYYWSSSEYYYDASKAWYQNFTNGNQDHPSRYLGILSIRCVRSF